MAAAWGEEEGEAKFPPLLALAGNSPLLFS
jgi:hypothetical protein